MKLGDIIEEAGYGVIELGVEEVVFACIDAALPNRKVRNTTKVLRTIGKYAIGVATATKATESVRKDVSRFKKAIQKTTKNEKKEGST